MKKRPAYCGCKDKHGKVKPARYDIFCSLRCAADRGVAETEEVSYCERHGWADATSCYHCIQEEQAKLRETADA